MKYVFSFLLFCSTSLTAFAGEPTSPPQLPEKEDFHLFLLIGQSNMAGRGTVEPSDKEAHPRVLTLTKENEWDYARDPLHFDKPVAGVGLGRTFGLEVAEAEPGIVVGLIPCAAGGSSITSWVPGGYHGQTKSHPYDDTLKRCKIALKAGTLKGILWHQGESDSNPNRAPEYKEDLEELMVRLRKELDAEDVPFFVGQLGQFEERPWNEHKKQVDSAQKEIAKEQPLVFFISSDDLGHRGDEVHFNAEAYREFGRRYAEQYLKNKSE